MSSGWSILEEKRALRRAMRAKRESLAPAERSRATDAASALLVAMPEFAAAALISGYLPTRGELDPGPAVAVARARGASVVYPRVTVERPRLRFHRIAGDST